MKKHGRHCLGPFASVFLFLLAAMPFLFQSMAKGETNPVREEMAALDSAFKTIIDAVVLGDMGMIDPALRRVQDARERLEGAVKSGYQVSLPKNQSRLADFIKLDRQFHIDLEELDRAAATGQKKAVKNLAHKLLDACVGCHERFRK